MVPQWNADIIAPDDGAGTKVIGDNQEVQTTLSSGSNITIENGQISASGTLENVQADWTQENSEDPSYIQHKPNLATVATSGDYGDLSNRPDLSVYATTTEVADKADKVTGAVNGNLAGLDSNGNIADSGVSAANLVHDASYVHTDNNFSNADVTKLSGIAAGAEVNVQSSWTETDTSSDAYIVGKPDLSIYAQSENLATVATSGSYEDLVDKPTIPPGVVVDQTYNASSANAQSGVAVAGAIAGKQDTIADLATIRSGASAGATAVQPGDLATVATTGAYSDLSGTPTIPVVDQVYNAASANAQSGTAVASAISTKQDTISDLATIRSGAAAGSTAVQPSSLATVATTGDYADLQNKPSIPAAQVNSDWNSSSGVSQILNKPTLATVATTGDYGDLLNKPTIPAAVTVDQTYSASSTNAQSGTAVAEAVAAISMDEVPAVTSSDNGKVLKATYSGGQGSYAWATEQGTTYTAGDGIDITNNEISVKVGTGLEIGTSTVQEVHNLTCSESVYDQYQGYVTNDICQLTPDLISRIKATGGLTITLEKNYSVGANWWYLALYSQRSNAHYMAQNYYILKGSNAGSIGPVLTYDNSDYDSTKSNVSLATIEANYADYRLGIIYKIDEWYTAFAQLSGSEPEVVATYTDTTTVHDCVNVSNPLPSSAQADAGKVLTVVDASGDVAWTSLSIDEVPAVTSSDDAKVLTATYSGGVGSYAWESAQGGTVDQTYNASSTNAQSGTAVAGALAAVPTKPIVAGSNITITENSNNVTIAATNTDTTYTAGNMIAINANNSNAISVSTTAGITDIQQVAALPANPVSTVLYLIPET